jgi:hypothetical protein
MAAPSINGIAVPASMRTVGPYTFFPQEETRNGAGLAIAAGMQRAEWSLGDITTADLTWWRTTILGGARSATITAELWDQYGIEFAVTSAVLHRPRVESLRGGLFRGVVIEFTNILPIR